MPTIGRMSRPSLDPVSPRIVAWAGTNLRDLPWRRSRDPWEILVAETMLQQTQVARVLDRWVRFLARFPEPISAAAAPAADVVREWEGMGYNRRALLLHRAAGEIVERHDGVVPRDLDLLMALPGIGPYTARAVRAFAFEAMAAPVDTNIGRVLARLEGRRLTAREAQASADALVPDDAVWIHNQGMMELGATICTARAPGCDDCPLRSACSWRGVGDDPAPGSAATSRPQSRFAGSDRQLRGRLVDVLRRGPLAVHEIAAAISCDDEARRARVVRGLVDDGLVEIDQGFAQLAGEAAMPAL